MSTCNDNTGEPCPDSKTCDSPWDLTETGDNCYINDQIEEALDIAGAPLNVFKLLGVHEQGLLIDLAENGRALSSGAPNAYPAENAFQANILEWRSLQKGSSVVASSYIGYDFGEIKLDNGRDRYGIDTNITHHITTIVIQQGALSQNRATKVRLERSDDGITWYGSAIVDLPDDADAHQISVKRSAKANKWRLRPITFNGGTNDHWAVKQLQMMEFDKTKLDNVEDYIFLENRNRDYANEPIEIKGSYDLIDVTTELSKFGIELPSQSFYITVSFSSCVSKLGRPLVPGDILEMPSETQYTATLEPVKKYVEVTDVAWSTEGYTPGWKPTLLRIVAQPAMATQETQDIFGDFVPPVDDTGFLDIDTDKYVDLQPVSDTIKTTAEELLPERGEDNSDFRHFTDQEKINAKEQYNADLSKLDPQQVGFYVEDGLPPNGEPYTEGDYSSGYPSNPANGAYHRMTYDSLSDPVPARLFRYSVAKNRWIFVEADRRAANNPTKPAIQKALGSSTRTPSNKIGK